VVRARDFEVAMMDGTAVNATVVALDLPSDVAVLKLDADRRLGDLGGRAAPVLMRVQRGHVVLYVLVARAAMVALPAVAIQAVSAPRRFTGSVFVVHSDPGPTRALAFRIEAELGCGAIVPAQGESVALD
jgi:hypothetical protein